MRKATLKINTDPRIAENITKTMQGYDISGKENVVASLLIFPGQNPAVVDLKRGAVEVSERKLGKCSTSLGCLY